MAMDPPFRVGILNNFVVRNFTNGARLMLQSKSTTFYSLFIILVLILGAIGPNIAPHGADEIQRGSDGEILRLESPSISHPMGTNNRGYDVLSRILIGARPTAVTGLLGGLMIISIGMTIGVSAGYLGGWVDDILMRFTDIIYGVPLIPFAIVLIGLVGIGFINSIAVIGFVLWRTNARVLRSQVLQIKERQFIMAAKADGASTPRILMKHIVPNIASMAILFFALGIGHSILIQASLAFIGVSNPFVPSWGVMLRNVYESGVMAQAWWWSIPPGLLISTTVLSTFMFGRKYEELAGQTDEGQRAIYQ